MNHVTKNIFKFIILNRETLDEDFTTNNIGKKLLNKIHHIIYIVGFFQIECYKYLTNEIRSNKSKNVNIAVILKLI